MSAQRRIPVGFTVVELMIVVAVIGILAALTIASLRRARETSRTNICLVNQVRIDDAKEMFAAEYRKTQGTVVAWSDITPYLRSGLPPVCPAGGTYVLEVIGVDCYCTQIVAGGVVGGGGHGRGRRGPKK